MANVTSFLNSPSMSGTYDVQGDRFSSLPVYSSWCQEDEFAKLAKIGTGITREEELRRSYDPIASQELPMLGEIDVHSYPEVINMGNRSRTINLNEEGVFKVASINGSKVFFEQGSLKLSNAGKVQPGLELDGVTSDICYFTWRGRIVDEGYIDQFSRCLETLIEKWKIMKDSVGVETRVQALLSELESKKSKKAAVYKSVFFSEVFVKYIFTKAYPVCQVVRFSQC